MGVSTEQIRRAIRATAFNNAATAELLRKVSKHLMNQWLACELESAAVQLEIDADSLDVLATEIQKVGITKLP